MKAIKIILTIISVLVLSFFLTGLLIKETNYTAEVTIDKNIKEVFTEFNKPGNLKKWMPVVKSIDTLNFNKGITGSMFSIVIENQGQEIKMTEKVIAYVPNEKVTLFFDAEGMLKTDDYIFTEINESTKITLNASCKSDSYIMSCVIPIFSWKIEEQDQSYLNNFKEYIEK